MNKNRFIFLIGIGFYLVNYFLILLDNVDKADIDKTVITVLFSKNIKK